MRRLFLVAWQARPFYHPPTSQSQERGYAMNLMGIVLWRVLVAAIAAFMVGGLWYSPILFARPWMVAMGYDPENKQQSEEMKKGAGKLYGMAFLASLVSAAVLAKLFSAMGAVQPIYGMKIAFAVWLGFVATVQLTATLFGKKSIVLFFIDTGHQFVAYMVMALVLTVGR
jgi:hypothetical protein